MQIRFDANGRVLRASTRLVWLLGRAADDVAGQVVGALLAPSSRRRFEQEVLPALRCGEPVLQTPLTFVGAGGKAVPTRLTAVDTGDDEREQFAGVLDARPLAETWAPAQSAPLDALFEALPTPVVLTDPDGRVVRASRSADEALGYAEGSLMGRPSSELDPSQADAQAPEQEAPGSMGEADSSDRRAAGARFEAETVRTPLRDRDGLVVGHLLIILDRTRELRRREREAALIAAAAAAQQMRGTRKLAAGVAHGFNNLLLTMLSNAELVREDVSVLDGVQPDTASALNDIALAARQAGHLCHLLLAYTGADSVHTRALDLSVLAERTVRLLEPQLPPGVRVSLDLADDLPPAEVEAPRVEEVLVQLLHNAMESHLGTSGTVTVRTWAGVLSRAELDATVPSPHCEPGLYVVLEVEDAGEGMDAAVAARAFEPFFTTGATGRGLGLPAALGTARSHGGTMVMASAPQQGTRAQFVLPALSDADEATTAG